METIRYLLSKLLSSIVILIILIFIFIAVKKFFPGFSLGGARAHPNRERPYPEGFAAGFLGRMARTALAIRARLVIGAGRSTRFEMSVEPTGASTASAEPTSSCVCRSGEISTRFQASPSRPMILIRAAEGSSSQRRRPWRAERGKAW